MILGKIIGIFAIMLIGFGAGKIGWLPLDSSKYLSKIVINIAAPCVVISSISGQHFSSDQLHTLGIIAVLYFGQYLFQNLVALLTGHFLKVGRDQRGVFRNFYLFTNNGFMGFPVTLAIFGKVGLFYMVIVNILMPFFMYTQGIWNVKKDAAEISGEAARGRNPLLEFINIPILASLIGVLIYFLSIPIHPAIKNVLDIVGAMMTPLSMMVIGIQLTESSPRRLILNSKLLVSGILRVLVMPALFVGAVIMLPIKPLIIGVLTLNIMLPSAAMPVALAEQYGADATFAAEGNFLSTLFAVATIPIATAVFGGLF